MPSQAITKQDRDWEAEDDLRTITRAEEIKKDKKRMANVGKAAKRVVKEKEDEVRTIKSIAKSRKVKIKKPNGPSVTIKKGAKKPVKVKKNIKVY